MKFYLGIDPGKGGAFAIIGENGTIFHSSDFEEWSKVWSQLKDYKKDIAGCVIEKVSSRSGQGVKSIFTFGMNYGGWLALLELSRIPHQLVPPQRWQKLLLGSFPAGESKKRSVDFINRRYPHVKLKKSHHGISDAICLAMYALMLDRRLTGKLHSDS